MQIKMENGKHVVYDGDKKLGSYNTHEEAVEAMKKMKKDMMKRMAESLGGYKITREAMKDLCPKCFDVMTEKNITAVSVSELAESDHFIEADFSQGLCDAMGGDEGFFTRCAEKMQGKVDDPNAFCAALHKHCIGKYPAEESKKLEGVKELVHIEGKLLESDKSGKVFDVVLLEVGESKNIHPELKKHVKYTEQLLKGAVKLFEGIKAFAYEFKGNTKQLFDHLPDAVREAIPEGTAKNLVGWYEKPYFAEFTRHDGSKGKGIIARFHVAASWLRDILKEAWEAGKRDILGFSIDASADIDPATGEVLQFNQLDEVTVVTNPAAGGILLRLVASNNKHKQQESDMKEILAWLRQNHPKLVESLKDDEPEETLKAKVFEALNKALAETKTNGSQNGVTPEMIQAMIAEAVGKIDQKVSTALSGVDEKINDTLTARNTEAAKLATSKTLIDKKLSESTLPDEIKQELREDYEGKSVEEAEFDKVLARKQKTIAALKESGVYVPKQEREAAVQVKQEEFDKQQKAMDAMIMGKDQIDGVKAFRSLHESYRLMTGFSAEPHTMGKRLFTEAGMAIGPQNIEPERWKAYLHESAQRGRVKESLLQVSTWAEAFGDSIRRSVQFYYQWPDYQEWRKVVSNITSPPDFRTNRRVRVGGFGDLSTVTEGSTYTELAWPADEEATYAVSKKGNLLPLTMETMVNDDLGYLREMPRRLGLAAARTLYKFVFDFFNTNPTIYDGSALFVAGHSNLRSTALGTAALDTAIFDMMKQTELSSAERIGIRPKYILTSIDGMRTAFEMIKASVTSQSGRTETVDNFWKNYGLDGITPSYWTDTDNWYLSADPNMVPTIEVGFLGGQQEPEIFIQDGATIGSVFTADKITWKIRHIYSGAVLDYRGLHGSVV